MNRLRPWARRAINAFAIGVAGSLLLFGIMDYQSRLDYLTSLETALFWLQIVGFFVGLGLPPRVAPAVLISINALIYSAIAFGILSLIHRVRNGMN